MGLAGSMVVNACCVSGSHRRTLCESALAILRSPLPAPAGPSEQQQLGAQPAAGRHARVHAGHSTV